MKYCDSCGNEIKENSNYCTKCGKMIKQKKKKKQLKGYQVALIFFFIFLLFIGMIVASVIFFTKFIGTEVFDSFIKNDIADKYVCKNNNSFLSSNDYNIGFDLNKDKTFKMYVLSNANLYSAEGTYVLKSLKTNMDDTEYTLDFNIKKQVLYNNKSNINRKSEFTITKNNDEYKVVSVSESVNYTCKKVEMKN